MSCLSSSFTKNQHTLFRTSFSSQINSYLIIFKTMYNHFGKNKMSKNLEKYSIYWGNIQTGFEGNKLIFINGCKSMTMKRRRGNKMNKFVNLKSTIR